MCLQYKSFENTVGQGEIARSEQFLLYPVFFTRLENFLPVSLNLKLLFANLLVSKSLKYCETRNFRRALIVVDFVGKAIHEFKFTTNVWPRSLICDYD